jgi:hypothetical protein
MARQEERLLQSLTSTVFVVTDALGNGGRRDRVSVCRGISKDWRGIDKAGQFQSRRGKSGVKSRQYEVKTKHKKKSFPSNLNQSAHNKQCS